MIQRLTNSTQNTPSRTKRNLLILLGGSVATLGIWKWFEMSKHASVVPDAITHNQTLVDEVQHQRFVALSHVLTAHPQLDPESSVRIYQALSKHNPEFAKQADALFEFVQMRQLIDVDTIVNSLASEPAPLKTVLHQIIDAWYLGVVDSQVVVYASAFMFDPVRNVTGVPSYCHSAPDNWAIPPLGDDYV